MSGHEEAPAAGVGEIASRLRRRRRYTAQFRSRTYDWDELLNTRVFLEGEGVGIRGTLSAEEAKNIRIRVVGRPVDPIGGEAARSRVSQWLRAPVPVRRGRAPVSVDPPAVALRLFSRKDAAHYAREWRAHLSELVAAGEHRQARRDRRRLALRAPWLALELRVRALLRRRLRSPR